MQLHALPRGSTEQDCLQPFYYGPGWAATSTQPPPPIADKGNRWSLRNCTFGRTQSATHCVNALWNGLIGALGLLCLHTVTFHPTPGSNPGSRKQKLQQRSNGLGNKDIKLTYRNVNRSQYDVYLNMITCSVSHNLYCAPVWSYEQKPQKLCW
jgi:hypothetical protein